MRLQQLSGILALSAGMLPTIAYGQQGYEWSNDFNSPLFNGTIYDAVEWDDGTGPALYVAGSFTAVYGNLSWSIIKYDGQDWSPVGSGLRYVDEVFGNLFNAEIRDLEIFDPDGSGPEPSVLVAGGLFNQAGSNTNPITVENIAVWDGKNWSRLGAGLGESAPGDVVAAQVNTLKSFDDGNGPRLFAGGFFQINSNIFGPKSGMAVWNGSSWQPIGGAGVFGGTKTVLAMETFDDGSGEALYIGGDFSGAGVANTQNFARWDGTSWTSVASGSDLIQSFAVFDHDGVGGDAPKLTSIWRGKLQIWDGTSLSSLPQIYGSGISDTEALAVFDDGTGEALYLAPSRSHATVDFPIEIEAAKLNKWDGVSPTWTAVGASFRGALGSDQFTAVSHVLFEYDDGNGPELWNGGYFWGVFADETQPDISSPGLVKWNGSTWQRPFPVGGVEQKAGAFPWVIDAVAGDLDGVGPNPPALIVSGNFDRAGGVGARGIAAWDGTQWTTFGDGRLEIRLSAGLNIDDLGFVEDPIVFDDGSGPKLYVTFSGPDHEGVPNNRFGVFQWDGKAWLPVGTPVGFDSLVRDLITFDDGNGPALYATGWFTNINGVPAQGIARWNGSSWKALPGGDLQGVGEVMQVFDDGNGPALYVGGTFNGAGQTSALNIAKWDGASWSSLGAGTTPLSGFSSKLVVMDDGNGPALYAGGTASFRANSFGSTQGVARWDGTSWTSVGGGLPSGLVFANFLGMHNDGQVSRLYFVTADGQRNAGDMMAYTPGEGWATVPGASFTGLVTQVPFKMENYDDGNGNAAFIIGQFSGAGAGNDVLNPFTFDTSRPAGSIIRWGPSAPVCQADINGDGALNFFDISAFLIAFNNADPSADFTGDGQFNFFDISALLAAFNAGCP